VLRRRTIVLRSTPIVQQYNASVLERQKVHKEDKRPV